MNLQVVTANRLQDGAVVYLSFNDCWTDRLDLAQAVDRENIPGLLASAEQAVRDRMVVGAYAFNVTLEDGRIMPCHIRESIRARGPTTGTEVINARCAEAGSENHVSL